MADIKKLKTLIEAYGIAVRAGVITPCFADEKEIRRQIGLGEPTVEILKDWESTGLIRRPITLQKQADIENEQK